MGKFSYLFLAAIVSISSFLGCAKSVESNPEEGIRLLSMFEGQPADATQPAAGTAAPAPAELTAEKQYYISIPRAALRTVDANGKTAQKETEFLLSGSMIPQQGAATSTAMSGRVIYFELFEDGVDMYEATEGAVVTDDLPARRLLAKFPVVSQDANRVVINFDSGMKTLFISDWSDASDQFSNASLDSAVDTPVSRVFSVRHAPGRLTISQSVQASVRSLFGSGNPRFEVRYFLQPYVKTDYKAKTVKNTRHVRYFKSHAALEKESGASRTHILRFEPEKPITFAYSANTPKEFQEAVRDGILYWNRAFGKELVKAEKAPEGVTAPDPDYNVVQWVPWDAAGFAYADVIADPRTGRSLHGQVYLTSVFGISGVKRARIALRQLQALAAKEEPKKGHTHSHQSLAIRFIGDSAPWTAGGHCQQSVREAAASMAKGVSDLINLENASDQRILEMSQNYVREVVAHEIGHVLGLRHHFAANLGATMTAKDLGEWTSRSLTEGKFEATAGKYPATSVMEYTEYFAAAYNGQIIKEGKEVLPYDKDAIQWGYYDKNDVIDKKTLYCSDEEAMVYADCERFDPTGDTFLGTHTDIARAIQQLPGLFLENFVAAVAPADPIDEQKVEEVNLTSTFALKPVADALRRALVWFGEDTKIISVDNGFPFLGPLNAEARLDARWEDLQAKLKKVGSTDRMLFSHLPLNLTLDLTAQPDGVITPVKYSQEAFVSKVSELLTGPVYSKFIGLDGKEHSFTDSEKKVIEERAKAFGQYFEDELLKLTLSAFAAQKLNLAFAAAGVRDEDDAIAKIERQYANVARDVIMAVHPTKVRRGKIRDANIMVQEFKYPIEVRMLATRILQPSLGSHPYWSDDVRTMIHMALKSKVESALLTNSLQNFKDTDLSRSLRTWYSEQKTLLMNIPSSAAAISLPSGLKLGQENENSGN